MNKIKKILALLLLILNLTSYAQNSWSLEDCIDYALANNLRLNDFNYSTESNKENYSQSFRELLPTVTANSNYNVQYGRSVDPNNNTIVSTDFFSNNYNLNASITIFQGFQKLNKIASSKFLYKATQDEALQEKYLLAFRVMSAFYDIQFFEGLVKISKEQVNISLSNFNLTEKQIEIGLKAAADKYEAESVLIGDKLLVTQSENNLKAAKLKLIQEMNLKNTINIQINMLDTFDIEEEEKTQETEVDSIYNKALSFMPIIKAQENKVESAKKEVGFLKGYLYPSLSLSAGYGTGFFETNVNASGNVIPFNTQLKDNASQFIGLSLRIPISERWISRSQIKQQKIALMQATNNLDMQKQALQKLIQELVQSFDASKAEYNQTKQSEASHLLVYTIAQKKYDKGLISSLNLYQSKNLYNNAQNENLQMKLKLKVQKKTLDFYNGLPIFNIKKIN